MADLPHNQNQVGSTDQPLSSSAQSGNLPAAEPESGGKVVAFTTAPGEDGGGKKKIILGVLGLILLLASVPAAVFLVQQRQEIRQMAAYPTVTPTPTGVRLTPTAGLPTATPTGTGCWGSCAGGITCTAPLQCLSAAISTAPCYQKTNCVLGDIAQFYGGKPTDKVRMLAVADGKLWTWEWSSATSTWVERTKGQNLSAAPAFGQGSGPCVGDNNCVIDSVAQFYGGGTGDKVRMLATADGKLWTWEWDTSNSAWVERTKGQNLSAAPAFGEALGPCVNRSNCVVDTVAQFYPTGGTLKMMVTAYGKLWTWRWENNSWTVTTSGQDLSADPFGAVDGPCYQKTNCVLDSLAQFQGTQTDKARMMATADGKLWTWESANSGDTWTQRTKGQNLSQAPAFGAGYFCLNPGCYLPEAQDENCQCYARKCEKAELYDTSWKVITAPNPGQKVIFAVSGSAGADAGRFRWSINGGDFQAWTVVTQRHNGMFYLEYDIPSGADGDEYRVEAQVRINSTWY